MRPVIYLIFLLLMACGNRQEQPAAGSQPREPEQPGVARKAGNIRYYKGTLRGKIPVFVWLRLSEADSILDGAVVYTAGKSRTPIRLLGNKGPEGSFLQEYLPDGRISGSWSGQCKPAPRVLSLD